MMLRNNVSRYHVIEVAVKGAAKHNPNVALDMTSVLGDVRHQVSKMQEYFMANGTAPEGTFDLPNFEGCVFKGGCKRTP